MDNHFKTEIVFSNLNHLFHDIFTILTPPKKRAKKMVNMLKISAILVIIWPNLIFYLVWIFYKEYLFVEMYTFKVELHG